MRRKVLVQEKKTGEVFYTRRNLGMFVRGGKGTSGVRRQ